MLDLEGMIAEADNRTPLLCLLSVGSDPTNQIDALAKNIGQAYNMLSMGQGQEEYARKLMLEGMEKGEQIKTSIIIICIIFFSKRCLGDASELSSLCRVL